MDEHAIDMSASEHAKMEFKVLAHFLLEPIKTIRRVVIELARVVQRS